MKDDVLIALDSAGIAPHEPYRDDGYHAETEAGEVIVPYRVYFPPARVEDIAQLSTAQQAIFAAIMTRHHSGYQREYWARILCLYPSTWAAPYLAALLSDYVIQVLTAVQDSISDDWEPLMRQHVIKNDMELRKMNHRIIDYWTNYYRYSPPNIRLLTDYPGYTLAKRLGLWDRKTAPKLLRKARRQSLEP